MSVEIHQFPYNSDNYGVLLREPGGRTACVDAGDAGAVMAALDATGWSLDELWMTHHHGDHTAGLADVKARTGAVVRGPSGIDGVDAVLSGGDTFDWGDQRVEVIHTPGHTMDMLNFYLPQSGVVFAGDTLFVMGCGRVIEGDMPTMWNSLQKLADLPRETQLYCAHEYTEANARFALSVEPDNTALQLRADAVKTARAEGRPTVPTTLAEELDTNPFLRAVRPEMKAALGMEGAADADVFGELRRRKDAF